MRQSGHWQQQNPLTEKALRKLLAATIDQLDVAIALSEVAPFIKDSGVLELWSQEFFHDVIGRIRIV
jgi:hypothetical protein